MISALKIRQRKFNFGQVLENKGTANLPLARKRGEYLRQVNFIEKFACFCSLAKVNASL